MTGLGSPGHWYVHQRFDDNTVMRVYGKKAAYRLIQQLLKTGKAFSVEKMDDGGWEVDVEEENEYGHLGGKWAEA